MVGLVYSNDGNIVLNSNISLTAVGYSVLIFIFRPALVTQSRM